MRVAARSTGAPAAKPSARAALLATLVLVPLALAPPFGEVHAQTVVGQVTDPETGAAVAGARVAIRHPAGRVMGSASSAEDGSFIVAVQSPGSYLLEVSATGFAAPAPIPVTLAMREELHIELKLGRHVVALEPLIVTARRRDPRHDATWEGALARREIFGSRGGSRRVLMHEDPQMRASMTVVQAIRDVPPMRGRATVARRGEDAPTRVRGGCNIVYWNGRLVTQALEAAWVLDTSTNHVEAVEIYRTWHDAPQELRDLPPYILGSPVNCSVVALWPRTGTHSVDATRHDLLWIRTLIAVGLAALLLAM